MRRIVVRNFGPIAQAEVELKGVNIIIGPQSAGKSCLLKVACYCTWPIRSRAIRAFSTC